MKPRHLLRNLSFATVALCAPSALAQEADLAIFKTVDKGAPLVGTQVVFTLQAVNNGPDNATGVTVQDPLPAGYEFVSVDAPAAYDPVTGVWTIGNLPNGEVAWLDITVKVLDTGGYINIATIDGNEDDPVGTNNTANRATTPTANLYWEGGEADANGDPDGVSQGGAGTWNATLKNWDPGYGATAYWAWPDGSDYTGAFAGTAGVVALGSNIAAGKLAITGAYTIALGENTLTLGGSGNTITGNAAINVTGTAPGGIVLGSNQTWDNNAAANTVMTVSAPVNTGDKLLTLNTRNNNLDVTGIISGSGGLTVNSAYTSGTTPTPNTPPTLNDANDYTGTTKVNGWIWLNSGGVSAFGADTSPIEFNNGGVRLTGNGTITRGIVISGTSGISKTTGTTTVEGSITGAGNLQLSANFGQFGPVVLAAANTFTGNCLSGPDGIVRLAHVDALANANLRWNDNNGRSVYDLSTHNLAYVIGGLGRDTLSNSSNNLNLGSGGVTGVVSFGSNNQSNTYVGILSGTAGFRKIGTGTQTLIGANAYTGNTVVAEGTLKLGKINGQAGISCTTGAPGTNVNRLVGLTSAVVNKLYIGQLVTGDLVPEGARITQINTVSATNSQITISPGPTATSTATTVTFADIPGTLTNSPVIEVQAGATLNVVDAPLTVGADQTLGGTGAVVGVVTAEGKISPALDATGTLTTGDIAFGATGSYDCTLNGGDCDVLAADALTVDPAAKVSVSGTPSPGEYVIATYTGAEPTHFDTSALPSGYSLSYATPGQIKLLVSLEQTPFQAWASGEPNNLTGADALPGADPDGDGVANILEFALGGDPKSGASLGFSLAKVQDVDGSPALTLTLLTRAGATFDSGSGPRTAARDGVTYRVEAGTDLSGWTATVTEVTPAITAGLPAAPAGYEYHTFRTAGPLVATPKDFIRVKVDGQ